MTTITIGDIFTDEEIRLATTLRAAVKSGTIDGSFAQVCVDEVVAPVIERINKDMGQENDPKYLAYALECALMSLEQGESC